MKVHEGILLSVVVIALGFNSACAKEQSSVPMDAAEHFLNGRSDEAVFTDAGVAHLATAACHGRSADVIQSRGQVDPNTRGVDGITPLLWAQDCRSLAGMEALLQVRANPNQSTGGQIGFTPVCIAAGLEDPSFLALLLRYGGDPNSSYDGDANPALELAFHRGMLGNWENYNALIEAGADINRPHAMRAIAEAAAALGQYDKVAQMLQRGYNHNLPRLALFVQTDQLDVMAPSQVAWATRVRTMLEQRGVRFPVRPEDTGIVAPALNSQ